MQNNKEADRKKRCKRNVNVARNGIWRFPREAKVSKGRKVFATSCMVFRRQSNKGTEMTIGHLHTIRLGFKLKHDRTNKMTCVSSKDPDQHIHPPSLISLRCPSVVKLSL